jgi:hypothetical protein
MQLLLLVQDSKVSAAWCVLIQPVPSVALVLWLQCGTSAVPMPKAATQMHTPPVSFSL